MQRYRDDHIIIRRSVRSVAFCKSYLLNFFKHIAFSIIIWYYIIRKEITDELNLSEITIKTYTRTLYGKLCICSREELYALLLK
ncbi:MAG: response regulator transcription factor [Ruminococcaceae bacterium]|nr:response regulator transcription factor [Oscillospiraceae bacterium]